ncbi:PQQ-binding-like beta-propeller repeat protein [Streptomyces sp. NPDC127119]|uniref:outer membrane protein assembly factor BamB family protein n=1 Tax=Streptomyces sp. NPDC127119 TaxID=3345370 RepID=UPI0036314C8B
MHLLDDDLRIQQSSTAVGGGQPIRCLVSIHGWVVGRDRLGNLTRWAARTLDLVDSLPVRVDETLFDAPAEQWPGLVGNHELTVCHGRLYTHDRAGRQLVVGIESFSVQRALTLPLPAGNDLSAVTAADVQHVHYDGRHDRFWAVGRNSDAWPGLPVGVALVSPQGSLDYSFPFSRYQVDFLEFSPDFSVAYAGGREGVLHILENTEERPTLARTVGGFPHQLTDLTVGTDGSLFVLSLSGELVKVDPDVQCVQSRAPVLRQGAWTMTPAMNRQDRSYCGTDDGVAVIEPREAPRGGFALVQMDHHDLNFGMIRDLAAVPGGYVGLGQREVVFRADDHGELLWQTPLDDFGVGLAVSGDSGRVLVATGVGALELCVETGRRLHQLSLDGVPLSAAAYGLGDERILANNEGVLCACAPDTGTELWRLDVASAPRHIWPQDGTVYVLTAERLLEMSADCSEINRSWGGDLRNATVALVADGQVHVATADGEMYTYDRATGTRLGVVDNLPDVPRTLVSARSASGEPHLVIGGRGGYLSNHRVGSDGPPTRVRDTYLRRGSGQAFRLHCQ